MATKVIALACSAGMSTSLLVTKMQGAAKAKNKDYEIYAVSVSDVDNMLEGNGLSKPNVLLLGPQVSFMKNQIGKKAQTVGIPVDVIQMQDYGTMNGEKVLQVAEDLM